MSLKTFCAYSATRSCDLRMGMQTDCVTWQVKHNQAGEAAVGWYQRQKAGTLSGSIGQHERQAQDKETDAEMDAIFKPNVT